MKLGYGFGDNIGFSKVKPKVKKESFSEASPLTYLNLRLGVFYFPLVILFAILLGRLFYLQVVEGERYRLISKENRVRVKTLPAPRGIIFDRKGEILVRNTPGYRLKIGNEFKAISHDEALQIEAKEGTEAANLEVDILREYLYPKTLAHVLGYTSEVNQNELSASGELDYELGEKIGRTGIEKEYDKILRGKKGREFLEVDAQEKKLDILGEVPPQSGQNLTLTIDLDLQKKAAEALGEVTGAVVVLNPQNGEILALVSHPSFNPNLFTQGGNPEEIENLFADEEKKPLFNRAISGLYPPGSTFKIVTAAAGLESGKINPQTQIEDVGEIVIGPYRFPNWYLTQYGKTEGVLDLVRAIARSNDIFFYKVAEWVGEKELGEWAKKFGLGQRLGIDLEGESEGLIPTPSWKESQIGEKWYLGDTYHIGIGQGYILTTPLQVSAWTSVIANGGSLYKPHLVKNSASAKASADKQGFLKKETVELIREGMRQACSEGGTGWPLFNFKVGDKEIQTACKTGTAEYGDPKGKTHAWFTVFAPIENPELVITVLVEGGGEGSSVAAPIAKKILEEWFGR